MTSAITVSEADDTHAADQHRPQVSASPVSSAPIDNEALVEEVARAIDNADPGYSIRLTNFVDGISTYTVTVGDDVREFDSHYDALLCAQDLRLAVQARAVLALPSIATCKPSLQVEPSFQSRVQPWLLECFGEMIAGDREERNHRFLEEALELVQSLGCTASEAHQLVDYTFGRSIGEPFQESGGVSVTHAALCLANNLDMDAAAETELARIWTKVEKIRAKQAAKPKYSPLPEAPKPATSALVEEAIGALEDVVNPLGRLQREAEATGAQLSGMAYSIANDLSFVQQIARATLAKLKEGRAG